MIASLAEKVLAQDGRLLIVAADEAFLARLDRMLWDQGADELPAARPRRRRRRRAPADPAVDQPRCAQPRPQHADRRRRLARGGADLRPRFLSCSTTARSKAPGWRGSCWRARDGVERRYWAQRGRQVGQEGLSLAATRRARLGGAANSNHIQSQETARSWPRRAPFRSSSPMPPAAT